MEMLTAVFGVAALIGGGLAGLLYGGLRTLRDTSADLRARVGDLEKERATDKAEKAELATENKFLRSALTGKVEWTALTDQLEEHHRQALRWWEKFDDRLEAILATMTGESK